MAIQKLSGRNPGCTETLMIMTERKTCSQQVNIRNGSFWSGQCMRIDFSASTSSSPKHAQHNQKTLPCSLISNRSSRRRIPDCQRLLLTLHPYPSPPASSFFHLALLDGRRNKRLCMIQNFDISAENAIHAEFPFPLLLLLLLPLYLLV